jgi:hypothetical protein
LVSGADALNEPASPRDHAAMTLARASLLVLLLAPVALADGVPLAPGAEVEGALARGDAALITGELADRFTFDVRAGQRVELVVTSDAFAPRAVLVDPDKVSTEAKDARQAVVRLEARIDGACTLLVVGTTPLTVGRYTVRLTVADSLTGGAGPRPRTPPAGSGGLEGLWGHRTDGGAWSWWTFTKEGWAYQGVPAGGVARWDPARHSPRDAALSSYAVKDGKLVLERGVELPYTPEADGTATIGTAVYARLDRPAAEAAPLSGTWEQQQPSGFVSALTFLDGGRFELTGPGKGSGSYTLEGTTLTLTRQDGAADVRTLVWAQGELLIDGAPWDRRKRR